MEERTTAATGSQPSPFTPGVEPPCPSCGSGRTRTRRIQPWNRDTRPATRTRYHACDDCDRRFSSTETATAGAAEG